MPSVIGAWRSLGKDPSVLKQRAKPGTVKKTLLFALPYTRLMVLFLLAVIVNATIGMANPLLYRQIINNGILKGNTVLIIHPAIIVAILGIFDGALGMTQTYLASKIGAGIVLSLRTRLFAHIQRMPLAFFTRTQTGALVSRLNNDVIGAQQAFTDLLSNVIGNLVTVIIVVGVMFFLSWPITLAALILLPIFLIPARFVGQRIGSLTKEGYDLNSEMNMVMQERFQVGGAMLVKLNGRPAAEAEAFDAKAGRVRDIGIAQATYARFFFVALTLSASLATAIVYGVGGVAAIHGTLPVGTVV